MSNTTAPATPEQTTSDVFNLILKLIGILWLSLKYIYVPGYKAKYDNVQHFDRLIRESIARETETITRTVELLEEKEVIKEQIRATQTEILAAEAQVDAPPLHTEATVDTQVAQDALTRLANGGRL